MSIFQIKAPDFIKTTIQLTASKSISNRALILSALSKSPYPISNLSISDDTQTLQKALNADFNDFDIGAAGTSMRFLTAYLSQKEGTWSITGTERMKNRPIKVLVDALRELGADIEYLEKEGFPPLKIKGKQLHGGKISLNGSISSQYISALMMIAPCLSNGMIIHLQGDIISRPYIQMTTNLMNKFGVEVKWEGKDIYIPFQEYKAFPFEVESDWSGASYWYEIMALANENAIVELNGLKQNSSQGDSKGAYLFRKLGVESQFTDKGVILKKGEKELNEGKLNYDFINEPDLAQTFVVACCLLGVPFRFTGLQTLKIKETDRILALQKEMQKLGYILKEEKDSVLLWNGEKCEADPNAIIATYEDHRMAMAFAPACIKTKTIRIEDPEVVSKSYPDYWKDLQQSGFKIQTL